MSTSNHERMTSVDTAWLRMDSPGHSMMIVGVSATATPVRAADFRRMIEQRLLCFRRFRHRPVADALGASWVEDDDLDIDAHVKQVTLPAPGGKAELEALASELASTPLDPRRPLWQFHFVPHYYGGSAWVTRVHHCYADGMAMIRVLLSMTEQDPAPGLARHPHRRVGGTARRPGSDLLPERSWVKQLTQPAGDILENVLAEAAQLLEGGIHQLFHPGRAAGLAGKAGGMIGEFARFVALPDDPDTPLRGPLCGSKAIAWGTPIPLQEVRTIAKALGCTVNDVMMSTVAGALGGYLRAQGVATDGLKLRASVPVNLRGAEDPVMLGNRFGLVFVEMAVGLAHPLQRLYATSEAMAASKGSLQPPMSLMMIGLMGMVPAVVQAPAVELFSRKASAVVSNVPGPQAPLYLCGQRISEMYFWVPQSGTIGLGVSILSYAGQVYFGLISDRKRVASPQHLVARFVPEFEKLLLAATVGALAVKHRAAQGGKKPASARRSRGPDRRRGPAT